MTNSLETTTEERAWLAMADHFLDTETRTSLPRTALRCVEAGMDDAAIADAFLRRVAPLVAWNTLAVAGEWAGWNDAELLADLRAKGRGSAVTGVAIRMIPGVSATLEAIVRFARLLAAADDHDALCDAVVTMAEYYVDFGTRAPLKAASRSLLVPALFEAFEHAIAPVTWTPRERRAGAHALAVLRCQLRNRRASGIDLGPLYASSEDWVDALGLPFTLPPRVADGLRWNYAEPIRAYHDLAHVVEVLATFRRVPDWGDPSAVALAILFHDAVYVPGAKDNEANSAARLATFVRGTDLARHAARAQELVLLTAKHGALDPADVDADAARFLDCDMAVLGASPDRYDAYEEAIALEHAGMPARLYRHGRARFLDGLLARERIFLSDQFHAELDAPARANLRRAREALR